MNNYSEITKVHKLRQNMLSKSKEKSFAIIFCIRVAPESWDPLYPRAFGIFFLCRTLAKNAEIADFWKHLVIFA